MGASSSKIVTVIILVGPYGCGKSQFIDCLTQRTKWANDSLHIQNHPVRSVRTKMAGYSALLVDTPGFDDYSKTADDVLEEIKHWLLRNHRKAKLANILYLQDIQDNRRIKSPPIRLLQNFCGGNAKHLIFVTTHWDQVEFARGEAREAQFRSFVRSLLRAGARTDRFDKTTESAWRIVQSLVDH